MSEEINGNKVKQAQEKNGNVHNQESNVNGNITAKENNIDGNVNKPKQQPRKKQQNKNNKSRNNKNQRPDNDPTFNDLKKIFAINEKVHHDRLTSFDKNKFDGKVRFTPLGGLGEIGGNMAVFETENSAIIIDCGMSFPTEDMHGVDILVPDFSYIRKIKDKIVGIVITHAHEDHIGAIPYLFKEMQFPIYATAMPLGMIANKFDEHKLQKFKSLFRPIAKRKMYKMGDFGVEWMHVTHSIIDCSSLAIQTEAGTIIHTGDFKIDHTPVDNYPTDIHRFAYYGERGVLALLSDSTNSHAPGFTKTEKTVGPTLDRLISQAKGRVLMSTFSSNLHRIIQGIDAALKYGRKICVIGRSMEKNIENARALGYLDIPESVFVDPFQINKYKDNDIFIVTTGSQGEAMSALFRMAIGEHRHVKIKPSDTVIISAKAIPGNEGSVSRLLNFLHKHGAHVAYQDIPDIHVSGHASQEEQKLILRLVKPKYFLPVHGEYNHILKHQKTGVACGVPLKNSYLLSDGDQIELSNRGIRKVASIKHGKTYIDNQFNKQIDNDIVTDRQNLAEHGIVTIIAQLDPNNEFRMIGHPQVVSFGIVPNRLDRPFAKEIQEILETALLNTSKDIMQDKRSVENEIRQIVRKHIYRKMKKYPTIIPTLIIM